MKKATQLIFKFFLKPEQDSFSGQTITDKIKWLLFLLVFEMPFLIVFLSLYYLLLINGLVNSENHLVGELIKNNNITFIVIFLILVGPFIEELIFRLPLRYKKANFIPLTVVILFFAGTLLFKKLHLSLALSIPLFVVFTAFSIFYIFNRRMAENRDKFLSSNYPYFFYSLTILFALIHISNFNYSVSLLLFAPIIVLPQFVAGFLFGLIRIKQGFIWGFFLHALHNAIFILPVLLFPYFNNPKLIDKIDKDDYTFEVYDGNYFSKGKSSPAADISKVTANKIELSGTFKNVVSKLTRTNKKYIWFKNSILAEKEISLIFRNNSAKIESAKISSQIALENLLKSYNLETKNEKRDLTIWYLSVKNEHLFATHFSDSVDSINNNTIRGFYGAKDTLKLNNINSEYFARTLQIAFDNEIQNEIDTNTVFSIEIPNDDFNGLKHFLESNFGLTIEKKTEKRDMLVIF